MRSSTPASPAAVALAAAVAVALAPACSRTNTPDVAAVSTCAADEDCTFWCETKGGCCHNPYCETPALAVQARAIEQYNREHCTSSDYAHCPQIGSRAPTRERTELHCRSGACVVDRIPCPDGGFCGGGP
jgi:hypothetical protein